mgnify:CR=1 FL=1
MNFKQATIYVFNRMGLISGIRKILVRDIAPRLSYHGRIIYIESDGTPRGTHIFIDGKEQRCIKEMTIHLCSRSLVEAEIIVYDPVSYTHLTLPTN